MHACMHALLTQQDMMGKPRVRVFGVRRMYQQCMDVFIAHTSEYNNKTMNRVIWCKLNVVAMNACMHCKHNRI